MDAMTRVAIGKPKLPKLPLPEGHLSEEKFRAIDRVREALTAQATGGLSPASLAMAFMDWSIHLASAPGKCLELTMKAGQKAARLGAHIATAGIYSDEHRCIEPLPGDYRFTDEGWRKPPYNVWSQAFLLNQQWWHNVTHGVPGVTPHHEDVVSFAARQFLDMFSPSNIPFANPEVVEKTIATGGQNFVQGFRNWLEDASRVATQ
ncbi:MAG TPA: poly-beta-hydroxybutyrate polymerase N-terminal domain-containing protein, partial [Anaerolineales bacterium]|nr:poly-beta-hydroxybutyrate polymerase N-terminal domain-containing protein [Anaerolineales bacterium]